jgi:proline dehydrogenase
VSLINNTIVSVVKFMPRQLVWVFSKRYIAGETLQDAVSLTKSLNAKGIYSTIDVLGESVSTKAEAVKAKEEALKVLDEIQNNKLLSNLSIKPTQMGLGLDEDFAFQQVEELVAKAEKINNFVRIDMEDSPYTDSTINLYKRLKEKYNSVGIAVQAYLKRTYSDVVVLNGLNTNYRLCKGIYIEHPSISYKDREKIRENFLNILIKMFKDGVYVGIATHDEYLINQAYRLINEMKIPTDKFEFQMLLGVTEHLRNKINSDGYKIRIYVPYGKDWYRYSMRRLQENPQVAGHIVKNLIRFNNR